MGQNQKFLQLKIIYTKKKNYTMKFIKLFEQYTNHESDIMTYQGGMLASYLETALWSSHQENDEDFNFDDSTIFDFNDEAITRAKNDVDSFVEKAGALLEGTDPKQVGHDFWLTRNHHGAGFWDGDYDKEIGEALTKISHDFKEINLIFGTDGKVHML